MRRFIATIVVLVFTVTSAELYPLSVLAQSAPKPAPNPFPSFSQNLARLEEEHIGKPKEPKIILVQDAHTSIQAQKKISQLIQDWVNKGEVKLVFAEGNKGDIEARELFPGTTSQRTFPREHFPENISASAGSGRRTVSRDIIREVSSDLVHSMEFGAVEDADAVSTTPFTLVGLEDIVIYEENLSQFKKTMKLSSDLNTLLKLLDKGYKRLERKFFKGEDLKTWQKISSFKEGKLSLEDYLKFLSKRGPPPAQFKHLSVLFSLLNDKGQINSSDLENQWKRFKKEHSEAGIQDLSPKVLDWIHQEKIDLTGYPALFEWAERQNKIESLKTQALMDELEEYNESIISSLPSTADAEEHIHHAQRLFLLKKLRKLQLSSQEWAVIRENPEAYKGESFWSFLRAHKSRIRRPNFSKSLEDYLKPAFDFYTTAIVRDQILFNNLSDAIRNTQYAIRQPSVLVVGGFHREGLTKRFQEAGFSYQVLSPVITEISEKGEKLYLKRITEAIKPKTLAYNWGSTPTGYQKSPALQQEAKVRISDLVRRKEQKLGLVTAKSLGVEEDYERKIYPLTDTKFEHLPEATREMLLRVGISDDLVKLTQAADWVSLSLFLHGFPTVQDIIHSPEDFKKVADAFLGIIHKTNLRHVSWIFRAGLPALQSLIHSPEDIERIGNDLVRMANLQEEKSRVERLFKVFPNIKESLSQEELAFAWPDLVDMAVAYGDRGYLLFETLFTNVSRIGYRDYKQSVIQEVKKTFSSEEFKTFWPDFVEMVKKIAQEDAMFDNRNMAGLHDLFDYGFPSAKGVFNEEFKTYQSDLIEIAKATSLTDAASLFDGLRRHKPFTPEEFNDYRHGFLEMVKANKGEASNLCSSISGMRQAFSPEEFKNYWPDLIKAVKTSEDRYRSLLYGFKSFRHLIHSQKDFKNVADAFLGFIKKTDPQAAHLIFYDGFPALQGLIHSPEDIERIGNDLVRMANLQEEKNRVRRLFKVFPNIKESLSQEELAFAWPGLADMAVAFGDRSTVFFETLFITREDKKYAILKRQSVIQDFKETFSSEELKTFWPDFVEIAKGFARSSIDKFRRLCHSSIPRIKKLFGAAFISYWPDLAKLAIASGEAAESLFESGLPAIRNLYSTEEDFFSNWHDWKSMLLKFIQATSDYNRDRMVKLIFKESKIFQEISEKDGDVKGHFDFYLRLIATYPRLALRSLEGLFEAIKTGTVSIELNNDEQQKILNFISFTNGFSPVLYEIYLKEGQEGLEKIRSFSEKALLDELSPENIQDYQNQLEEKGYQGKELVLAILQMVVPASGASFVKTREVMGLFEKYVGAGDRRPDIPETLRGPPDKTPEEAFIHEAAFTNIEYSLKKDEVLDSEGKVSGILSNIRYPDSGKPKDQAQEETEADKKRFIETLTQYLTEKTADNKAEAQTAFYAWVRHNDLLKEKVDRIQVLDHQSLDLLEQLFLDKDNLSILFREVIDKDIDSDLLVTEGRGTIRNLEGLLKQIRGVWFSGKLAEDARFLAMANILGRYRREEITQRLLPKLKDEAELYAVLTNLLEGELKTQVSIKALIEDFFKEPIGTLQKEKAKFQGRVLEEAVSIEFRIVKGVPYGLWGLCAGVCIATDINLWKRQEFFLLAMIDKDKKQAVGFIHLFEATVDGKKVLVVPGIEPSTEFLGKVKARDLYPELISAIRLTAKKGKYKKIFLPTNSNILSNRLDIARLVKQANYGKLPLEAPINWSTAPAYPISEVYVVPIEEITAKSLGVEEEARKFAALGISRKGLTNPSVFEIVLNQWAALHEYSFIFPEISMADDIQRLFDYVSNDQERLTNLLIASASISEKIRNILEDINNQLISRYGISRKFARIGFIYEPAKKGKVANAMYLSSDSQRDQSIRRQYGLNFYLKPDETLAGMANEDGLINVLNVNLAILNKDDPYWSRFSPDSDVWPGLIAHEAGHAFFNTLAQRMRLGWDFDANLIGPIHEGLDHPFFEGLKFDMKPYGYRPEDPSSAVPLSWLANLLMEVQAWWFADQLTQDPSTGKNPQLASQMDLLADNFLRQIEAEKEEAKRQYRDDFWSLQRDLMPIIRASLRILAVVKARNMKKTEKIKQIEQYANQYLTINHESLVNDLAKFYQGVAFKGASLGEEEKMVHAKRRKSVIVGLGVAILISVIAMYTFLFFMDLSEPRPDHYVIQTRPGRTIYLDDGVEISHWPADLRYWNILDWIKNRATTMKFTPFSQQKEYSQVPYTPASGGDPLEDEEDRFEHAKRVATKVFQEILGRDPSEEEVLNIFQKIDREHRKLRLKARWLYYRYDLKEEFEAEARRVATAAAGKSLGEAESLTPEVTGKSLGEELFYLEESDEFKQKVHGLIEELTNIAMKSKKGSVDELKASEFMVALGKIPTDEIVRNAESYLNDYQKRLTKTLEELGPSIDTISTTPSGILVVTEKPQELEAAQNILIKAIEMLNTEEGRESFLRMDEEVQLKILQSDILDLWQLMEDDAIPSLETLSLIQILQRNLPIQVRRKIYELIDRLKPDARFSDKELWMLLSSIVDQNQANTEYGRKLSGILTENLSSMSERAYRMYLEIIKKQGRLEFQKDGISNLPPQMTFGIELELALYPEGWDIQDEEATEDLMSDLSVYVQTLKKNKIISRNWEIGWDITVDDEDEHNIEIRTPILTNDPNGFRELERGLGEIRSFLRGWIDYYEEEWGGEYSLARSMHIHIGNPKNKDQDVRRALTFMGRTMEYLWGERGMGVRGGFIDETAFPNSAVVGNDYMDKNETFWYADEEKGTVAFNAFYAPEIFGSRFFEKLQTTIGIAMQVVNTAAAKPEATNILNWGILPVNQDEPYTEQNSYYIRAYIDKLFGDNLSGKLSLLRLLQYYKKLPVELEGKGLSDYWGDFFEEKGLGIIHEIHEQKGAGADIKKEIEKRIEDPASNAQELFQLFKTLFQIVNYKPDVIWIYQSLRRMQEKGLIAMDAIGPDMIAKYYAVEAQEDIDVEYPPTEAVTVEEIPELEMEVDEKKTGLAAALNRFFNNFTILAARAAMPLFWIGGVVYFFILFAGYTIMIDEHFLKISNFAMVTATIIMAILIFVIFTVIYIALFDSTMERYREAQYRKRIVESIERVQERAREKARSIILPLPEVAVPTDKLDIDKEVTGKSLGVKFIFDEDISENVQSVLRQHVKDNPLYKDVISIEVKTVQGDERQFTFTAADRVIQFNISGVSKRAPPKTYLSKIDKSLRPPAAQIKRAVLWSSLGIVFIAVILLLFYKQFLQTAPEKADAEKMVADIEPAPGPMNQLYFFYGPHFGELSFEEAIPFFDEAIAKAPKKSDGTPNVVYIGESQSVRATKVFINHVMRVISSNPQAYLQGAPEITKWGRKMWRNVRSLPHPDAIYEKALKEYRTNPAFKKEVDEGFARMKAKQYGRVIKPSQLLDVIKKSKDYPDKEWQRANYQYFHDKGGIPIVLEDSEYFEAGLLTVVATQYGGMAIKALAEGNVEESFRLHKKSLEMMREFALLRDKALHQLIEKLLAEDPYRAVLHYRGNSHSVNHSVLTGKYGQSSFQRTDPRFASNKFMELSYGQNRKEILLSMMMRILSGTKYRGKVQEKQFAEIESILRNAEKYFDEAASEKDLRQRIDSLLDKVIKKTGGNLRGIRKAFFDILLELKLINQTKYDEFQKSGFLSQVIDLDDLIRPEEAALIPVTEVAFFEIDTIPIKGASLGFVPLQELKARDDFEFSEELRLAIVNKILDIALERGGIAPRDFRDENIEINLDTNEVNIIDIERERLFIAGRHSSNRHRLLFLAGLVASFGFPNIKDPGSNQFIYEAVTKKLKDQYGTRRIAIRFFESVLYKIDDIKRSRGRILPRYFAKKRHSSFWAFKGLMGGLSDRFKKDTRNYLKDLEVKISRERKGIKGKDRDIISGASLGAQITAPIVFMSLGVLAVGWIVGTAIFDTVLIMFAKPKLKKIRQLYIEKEIGFDEYEKYFHKSVVRPVPYETLGLPQNKIFKLLKWRVLLKPEEEEPRVRWATTNFLGKDIYPLWREAIYLPKHIKDFINKVLEKRRKIKRAQNHPWLQSDAIKNYLKHPKYGKMKEMFYRFFGGIAAIKQIAYEEVQNMDAEQFKAALKGYLKKRGLDQDDLRVIVEESLAGNFIKIYKLTNKLALAREYASERSKEEIINNPEPFETQRINYARNIYLVTRGINEIADQLEVEGASLGWQEALKELKIKDDWTGETINGVTIRNLIYRRPERSNLTIRELMESSYMRALRQRHEARYPRREVSIHDKKYFETESSDIFWKELRSNDLEQVKEYIRNRFREVFGEWSLDRLNRELSAINSHHHQLAQTYRSLKGEEGPYVQGARDLRDLVNEARDAHLEDVPVRFQEEWKNIQMANVMSNANFWTFPIWVVDDKNEIVVDAMKWLTHKRRGPPHEWLRAYYDGKVRSLQQITDRLYPPIKREPPSQPSLFDDVTGQSLGAAAATVIPKLKKLTQYPASPIGYPILMFVIMAFFNLIYFTSGFVPAIDVNVNFQPLLGYVPATEEHDSTVRLGFKMDMKFGEEGEVFEYERSIQPLTTGQRWAMGGLIAGGAMLLDDKKLRDVMVFDITSSMLISSFGALRDSDLSALDNALYGGAAGLTMFAGKRFMAEHLADDGYMSFLGKPIHSVGLSVRDNLFMGKGPFERLEMDFGPLMMGVKPYDDEDRVDFALIPGTALRIVDLFAKGHELDWRYTLKTGTFTFWGDEKNFSAPGTGAGGWGRSWFNVTRLNRDFIESLDSDLVYRINNDGQLIDTWVGSPAYLLTSGWFTKETLTQAILLHETIHGFQYQSLGFIGKDLETSLYDNVNIPDWIRLDRDFGELFSSFLYISLEEGEKPLDDQYMEWEPLIWGDYVIDITGQSLGAAHPLLVDRLKDITFEKYDVSRLDEDMDDLMKLTVETEGKILRELSKPELYGYERALRMGTDSPYVFMARDAEGKPVGYIFGTIRGATIGVLPFLRVYVKEGMKRHGIGEELVRLFAAEAKRVGFNTLRALSVEKKGMEANAFYKNLGFRPIMPLDYKEKYFSLDVSVDDVLARIYSNQTRRAKKLKLPYYISSKDWQLLEDTGFDVDNLLEQEGFSMKLSDFQGMSLVPISVKKYNPILFRNLFGQGTSSDSTFHLLTYKNEAVGVVRDVLSSAGYSVRFLSFKPFGLKDSPAFAETFKQLTGAPLMPGIYLRAQLDKVEQTVLHYPSLYLDVKYLLPLFEYMDKHVKPGDRLWDLGAGTGIIGLRASRLGAEVVASGILDWEVTATKRNRDRWGIFDEQMDVRQGDLFGALKTGEKFDWVTFFSPFAVDTTVDEEDYIGVTKTDYKGKTSARLIEGLPDVLNPGGKALIIYLDGDEDKEFLETIESSNLEVEHAEGSDFFILTNPGDIAAKSLGEEYEEELQIALEEFIELRDPQEFPGIYRNPDLLAPDIIIAANSRRLKPEDLLKILLERIEQIGWFDEYKKALDMKKADAKWSLISTKDLSTLLDELKPLGEEQRLDPATIKMFPMGHGVEATHQKEEYEGFLQAVNLTNEYLDKDIELREEEIKELHKLLGKKLTYYNPFLKRKIPIRLGEFRPFDAERDLIYYPTYSKIPEALSNFFDWLYSYEAEAMHPVQRAAIAFYYLHSVHPFENGNTRTSSLLMNSILMKSGYPPFMLNEENEKEFMRVIRFMRYPAHGRMYEGIKESVFVRIPEIYVQRPGKLGELEALAKEFTMFLIKEIKAAQEREAAGKSLGRWPTIIEAAEIEDKRWIGDRLWQEVTRFNQDKEPQTLQIISIDERDADLEDQLLEKLHHIPDEEWILLTLYSKSKDQLEGSFDLIVALDQMKNIKNNSLIINSSGAMFGEFAFQFHIQIDSRLNEVRLVSISIGENYEPFLMGRGLIRGSFENMVQILEENYWGVTISTNAINYIVAKWFDKYFDAKIKRVIPFGLLDGEEALLNPDDQEDLEFLLRKVEDEAFQMGDSVKDVYPAMVTSLELKGTIGASLGEAGGKEAIENIVTSKDQLNLIYFLETVETERVDGKLVFKGRTQELIKPLLQVLENSNHQVVFVSSDRADRLDFLKALNNLNLPTAVRNRISIETGSLNTQKDFLKYAGTEGRVGIVAPTEALDSMIQFSNSNQTNWEVFVSQDELEGGTYRQADSNNLVLKDAYLVSFAFVELAEEGIVEKRIRYPSLSLFLSEAIQAWLDGFLAEEAIAKAA